MSNYKMNTLKKTILLSTFIASLTSCGNSSTSEQVANEQQKQVANEQQKQVANEQQKQVANEQQKQVVKTEPKRKSLTNFTNEDVARFAISSLMGQPSKTVKVQLKNGLYYVSYVRKSDSKKFDYKIKIDGNNIVWANIDGRWRDSEYDERISFEENNNKLKIIQTFSDGSTDIKEFDKGQ
jgi:hypothetical protein